MKRVDGYRDGKRFDLEIVQVGEDYRGRPLWLGTETAVLWIALQRFALRQGVTLTATSGFRFMADQQKLWNERTRLPTDSESEAAKKLEARTRNGGAARPGYSKHQSGDAIDIATGLSRMEFISGRRTETFKWLETHAPKFGFAVLTVAGEPWHFERVVTPAIFGGADV